MQQRLLDRTGALTDLVRQGKVRYLGSSSYSGVTVNPADNSYRDHELRPEQRRR